MPRQSSRNSAPTPRRVAELLLQPLGYEVVSLRELQTLWAGYGHVCSVVAKKGRDQRRLVLKLISPPPVSDADEGHLRKMLSYRVEQYFYAHVAPVVCTKATVAECLAVAGIDGQHPELEGTLALLLEDLSVTFPLAGEKRAYLTEKQVGAALRWLGEFHGNSRQLFPAKTHEYVRPPLEETKAEGKKLWLNGGYTYLATRRVELANLADEGGEWADAFCTEVDGVNMAERVAAVLEAKGRPGETTLIHGDVKSENLFTTSDQMRAAFFDFQYVGLGLGACDLAKLFTCSIPLAMLVPDRHVGQTLNMTDGETKLLEEYRRTLLENGKRWGMTEELYPWDEFKRHWETALVDWCRFQASWGFWGNTEWLEARVRHILSDKDWRTWLDEQ